MTPAEMTCPSCETEMSKGSVQVKGTFPAFLLIGLSYQHLWWKSNDGGRYRLLNSGQKRSAWRCPTCGTVVVPFERAT